MKQLLVFKSPLHDQESVLACRRGMMEALAAEGIETIDAAEALANDSLAEHGQAVCFIATGGTEEIFRQCHHRLPQPVILLSDGYHNSLAAAFEIATFLAQQGTAHHLENIPLGCTSFAHLSRLFAPTEAPSSPTPQFSSACELYALPQVKEALRQQRIGLVGGASSWLIASGVDLDHVSRQTGAQFVHIPLEAVKKEFQLQVEKSDIAISTLLSHLDHTSADDLHRAMAMDRALSKIKDDNQLTALTIKCFGLLAPCHTTACYSLARLNDSGCTAGCEGDVPTLWTMIVAQALTGRPSFMANPSSSCREALTVDFAHCTIPLSMTVSYRLPSHFESRIGIGIAGQLPTGRYRLMKIGGEKLDHLFLCEGTVSENTHIAERCRTQIRFRFDSAADFDHFFRNRTGNHVVLYQL